MRHHFTYNALVGLPIVTMTDRGCGRWRIEGPSTDGYYDLVHHGDPAHAEPVVSVGPSTGPRLMRQWWWEVGAVARTS